MWWYKSLVDLSWNAPAAPRPVPGSIIYIPKRQTVDDDGAQRYYDRSGNQWQLSEGMYQVVEEARRRLILGSPKKVLVENG